ncbi:threonine aldolase family protein [Azospirillum sp. ST 5-10]|uniref:threonine aldolase family protein n=1 Tax=unclassified Azospirillum TaxID=2630922 RepID=UPI003F49E18B
MSAYDFRSDNVAGAVPEVVDALAAAARGTASPYGEDPWTARVAARLAELFETEVAVFPVATGTAANALALSALTPSYGAVYCHAQSHIDTDECGAPELFTGGAKLVGLPGEHGRLAAADLERALAGGGFGVVHHVQPAALSLSQATEAGTAYRPAAVAALAEVAHRHGMAVHMDGARFANALAFLGCTPAEATWKAGVDALSLGATKGGAFAAEAVVFFRRDLADGFGYRRKRGGHLVSKMRFVSAQLEAWLKDGLWLRLAGHANAMTRRLADGLAALPGVTVVHPPEANELFVDLPEPAIAALEAAGFGFYRWSGRVVRLVTAFDTPPAAVDAFLATARSGAAAAR